MQEKSKKMRFIWSAFLPRPVVHVTIRKKSERGAALVNEVTRVVQAVCTVRCGAACTEEELHLQVARALENEGLQAQHEVRLAPRCRIDFMAGGVGIEIKKNRPERARLIEQLTRYARCERVEALVVVAVRGVDLPRTIEGKQVVQVSLERLWGISLP